MHPKVSQGDDGTHIPTLKCRCWCNWIVPGSDYDFWMILGGGLHGVLHKGFRYNLYICMYLGVKQGGSMGVMYCKNQDYVR